MASEGRAGGGRLYVNRLLPAPTAAPSRAPVVAEAADTEVVDRVTPPGYAGMALLALAAVLAICGVARCYVQRADENATESERRELAKLRGDSTDAPSGSAGLLGERQQSSSIPRPPTPEEYDQRLSWGALRSQNSGTIGRPFSIRHAPRQLSDLERQGHNPMMIGVDKDEAGRTGL